ncbi:MULTISPECIES: DUF4834 family protein [Myroides]|uniref:DUF4834 family protein n=1 Tax=Myroides albus TaxID=2562892 RepID=A0A6I3LG44_9FLAO|nr:MULTISPECIES: DUF4834 family protein [Myroides]MTG97448.1 DUF4834 family protein [Myroides albus]MVX36127.1 DUF4834 family protein [Myroides sp. LoEW2-1]UVD79479.1 DUF4834 family protein [Myroides albus]
MDTASFTGFLKTLCIIILVYYAFKFAMRYLFPMLVIKAAKKASENFQQRQQDFYQQNNSSTSSNQTTNNDDTGGKVPRSTKIVGEYIEFEEIDKK